MSACCGESLIHHTKSVILSERSESKDLRFRRSTNAANFEDAALACPALSRQPQATQAVASQGGLFHFGTSKWPLLIRNPPICYM
jgi:hypothetical protein